MSQNNLISKLNKNKIINLTGKTSISDLKHILNFSNMHIYHDDGTMHLAMLLNKKKLYLFFIILILKKNGFKDTIKTISSYIVLEE